MKPTRRVFVSLIFFALGIGLSSEMPASAQAVPESYVVDSPYSLQITVPPGAHFEIPPWTVPGGYRQLTVSTSYSYKCWTELNPLTDLIVLPSSQCILASRKYVPPHDVHAGNLAAQEWGRNWNGIFTQHWITVAGHDRLVAISAGENKNEYVGGDCGQGGECYPNTINTDVLCSDSYSGYCHGIYSDDWNSYNGLITMSWQYFDAEHGWGMLPHIEEGPIVWPASGYTFGGGKSSEGVRHPHGFVDRGYLWAFYEDKSYDSYGIKVARASVNSYGLPGNWQTHCGDMWVDSLPAGFDVTRITEFYAQIGGCASSILPTGGNQNSFAVTKTELDDYFGIEEQHDESVWRLRLWRSTDLVHWTFVQILRSINRGWDAGDLHYPVFLSADGWHNDRINSEDFYILGTRDGQVRVMRMHSPEYRFWLYLPFVSRH